MDEHAAWRAQMMEGRLTDAVWEMAVGEKFTFNINGEYNAKVRAPSVISRAASVTVSLRQKAGQYSPA